jgi:hypothetical protein
MPAAGVTRKAASLCLYEASDTPTLVLNNPGSGVTIAANGIFCRLEIPPIAFNAVDLIPTLSRDTNTPGAVATHGGTLDFLENGAVVYAAAVTEWPIGHGTVSMGTDPMNGYQYAQIGQNW